MQQDQGQPGGGRRSWLRRLRDRALPRGAPSRRDVLTAAAVAAATGLVSSPAPPAYRPTHSGDLAPYLPRLRALHGRLHATARAWVMAGPQTIARKGDTPETSYVYTVELAQLMEHFAEAGDLEPYLTLRDFPARHLIVDRPDESFTRGFVLWRCVPGATPDASGTTEALRVAKALWAGHKKFGRAEDGALALSILDGYARHETVDQGIWLIRNYYAFAGKNFATNTFVIDYDADFVRRVADDVKASDPERHKKLSLLADNSYCLMRRAIAPTGLLYDLVQPELKTMYWGLEVAAFSPNDVVQTNNACTTAATVARGDPATARGVLAFVTSRQATGGKVYQYYYGRTGERVNAWGLGAAETAAVVRLAALLGDRPAVGEFVRHGLPYWEEFAAKADPGMAWGVSEILLGMRDVLAIGA